VSRWLEETGGTRGTSYDEAFDELAASGVDVHGEAAFLDAQGSSGVTWLLADLATLELDDRFDAVLMAGNVIVFVEPGTEQAVVDRLAALLVPGGLLVSGWHTDRLAPPAYDLLVAGLSPVARHATWQGAPLEASSEWCVAVDRTE
jgi:SAM-dependent methyltransferase